MERQSGLADSGKGSPPFGRLSVSTQQQSEASASDRRGRGFSRALGLGLISGAADDDPSAIGTYASAGAKLGPSFLWTAPATLPMMFAVVYLSAKLGQVSGRGLFQAITTPAGFCIRHSLAC